MIARRRYQRFYPIKKISGPQPQCNVSLLPEPVPLQRRPGQPVAHLRPVNSPYQTLTGKHRQIQLQK